MRNGSQQNVNLPITNDPAIADRHQSTPQVLPRGKRQVSASDPARSDAWPNTSGDSDSRTVRPGITTGPNGNIWFTEIENNAIGQYNINTSAITEYGIPRPAASAYAIAPERLFIARGLRLAWLSPRYCICESATDLGLLGLRAICIAFTRWTLRVPPCIAY